MAITWQDATNGPKNADTISAAFKQQFADNFQLALQKTDSVLAPLVTNKGAIQGSSWTFQDMGTVEMQKHNYGDRFSETKFSIPNVSTRMAMLQDYDLYIPIEPTDVYRLTAQLDGPYMQSMVAAANRAKDTLIMDQMLGLVQSKVDNNLDGYHGTATIAGWTSQAFDPKQVVIGGTGKYGTPASATTPTAITKKDLIAMRALFRHTRADTEQINMLYNSEMLQVILGDTELTSADYMAVQMLQSGDVTGKWLGMNWVPYEELRAVDKAGLLGSDTGVDTTTKDKFKCAVAFTSTSMNFATGKNYTTDVGTRYDLRLVKQLSAQMSFGAGRANEQKIAKLVFAA